MLGSFKRISRRLPTSLPRTRPISTLPLPSANFNQLLQTISSEDRLAQQDKPAFKKYWEIVSENFPNARTLFKETDTDIFSQFVKNNRNHSSTVRAFYRREAIFNRDTLPTIQSLVGNKVYDDVLTFCIQDSISTRDIVIAADLFLLYYKLYHHEPIRHDILAEIISAIAFQHPKHDRLHLIKFLQLVKMVKSKKQQLKLDTTQTSALCDKALSLDNVPSLTKQVLLEVMSNSDNSCSIPKNTDLIAAYKLIHTDYTSRNAAGVYSTWINISNYYSSIADHDPRILYMVMRSCLNNKNYKAACKDIISRLSPNIYCNDPLILPTIIDYITKNADLSLAEDIMNNVNEHIKPNNTQNGLLSKRFLSSLLKMHLKFNDSKGVDCVLKQIHDTFGAYSQENYQAIVSHLLKTKTLDNIVKAVNIVSTIPPKQALLAYSSIINAIVEWQIASNGRFDKKSMPLIEELLVKAHKQDISHTSALWSIIASLYIKRLVHHKNFRKYKSANTDTTNLDLAKLIFLKSDKYNRICDYNPFAHSSPQNIILKLNNKNRIIILKNIALNAIKGHRKDIFLWCCAEIYHSGVTTEELLLDWHKTFNYKFRSMRPTSQKDMENELTNNGLKFLNNALK